MKKVVFILFLVFLGIVSQAQTPPAGVKWKYESGQRGGYAVTFPERFILRAFYPEEICDGSSALITLQMSTVGLYAYAWYEEDENWEYDTEPLATTPYLHIPECTYDEYNGKRYVCFVEDLNTGAVMEMWDVVELNVVKIPSPNLNITSDTTICYGSTLRLQGSPATSDYTYSWEGAGVIGAANTNVVNVRPEKTTTYILTMADGMCSATAAVNVIVNKPEITLKNKTLYVGGAGEVSIKPETNVAGQIDWKVGSTTYANRPVLNEIITEVSKVYATLKVGKCQVTDSMEVIPEVAFMRYAGGDNDGFVQSKQRASEPKIVPTTLAVCLAETAIFSCNVVENSTFTYQWYYIEPGEETGVKMDGETDKILRFEEADFSEARQYYCEVYDEDAKVLTKTNIATLEVLEIPDIVISYPSDTVICAGTSIKLSAKYPALSGETLIWSGYDIKTNPKNQEITVAPQETTVYEVTLRNAACLRKEEVTVTVQNTTVSIPNEVNVLRGESYTYTVPAESGVSYKWLVDGVQKEGDVLSFEYMPEKNSMVYVVKTEENCSAVDSCRVYVKEYGVGSSDNGFDDGYAENVLAWWPEDPEGPGEVCEGEDVVLSLAVKGYDVYEYAWKKTGSDEVLSTESMLSLSGVDLDDSGEYYCEVLEARSGIMKKSVGENLQVFERPVAIISSPEIVGNLPYEICKGQSVQLAAVTTTNPGISTYFWEGINVAMPNSQLTTAQPSESTTYSLIVSNGVCEAIDRVEIKVKDITIDLPEALFATEGYPLEINAQSALPAGATFQWDWKGKIGAPSTATPPLISGFSQSTVVYVTMTATGCQAIDSVRVYVRGKNVYRGGFDDGYVESDLSFRIMGLDYPTVVCEGMEAGYAIRLSGSGIYKYEWIRDEMTTPVSEEPTLTFPECTEDLDGMTIYCKVTDVVVGKTLTSEKVTLSVRKAPKAEIGYPARGLRYCIGETIRLDARATEAGKDPEETYTYVWEGERITSAEQPYMVDVRPTKTQLYTLKVMNGECVDYDTMTVNVVDPRIDIPSVVYINEGEMLNVAASLSEISVAAQVNWRIGLVERRNVNPLEYLVQGSTTIVAEISEPLIGTTVANCVSKDTMRVYVRTNKFFKGGDDDGFMESCEMPTIDPTAFPTVLGCGGVDSVSLDIVFSGDVQLFTWQKYTEAGWSNVTPADNITGLQTKTLTINPLQETDYGLYRCILRNSCGEQRVTFTVTNGNMPELLSRVDTMSFCEGQKNQQIVCAVEENEAPITFRWYKKNPKTGVVQQYLPEPEFNNKFLNFEEITYPDTDALYLCEAENSCGILKDSVRVIVTRKLRLVRQPVDTITCVNSPVRLSVRSEFGGSRVYILKKVTPDVSELTGYKVDEIVYTGAADNYLFPAIADENAGYYVWTVKAVCGDSVSTKMFRVKVESPVELTYRTPDTTLCYGTMAQLEVTAVAPESDIKYRWEKVSSGPISGTTNTISFPFSVGSEGKYICYARNACPETKLEPAIELKAHKQVSITYDITQDPNDIIKCEWTGGTLSFHVSEPNVIDSIRWFKYTNGKYLPVYDQAPRLTGTDSYEMIFDSLFTSDAGHYIARAYNVCQTLELNPQKNLTVHERPKILKHIEEFYEPDTVCKGTTATLQVEAAGYDISYIWLVNGHQWPAPSTANAIDVTFDSTATYVCRVYNTCEGENVLSSKQVTVIEVEAFEFMVRGESTYCEESAGVELMLAKSDTSCVYTLYRDEEVEKIVDGRDVTENFAPINFGYHQAGVYHVEAYHRQKKCTGQMNGTVTVKEEPLPAKFATSVTKSICYAGDAGVVTLENSTNSVDKPIQYMLYRRASDGSMELVLPMKSGTGEELSWEVLQEGTYRVKAVNMSGLQCSVWMDDSVTMSTTPLPADLKFVLNSGLTDYCEGNVSNTSLRLEPAGFEAGLKYELKKDGELTDKVLEGLPLVWSELTPGKYTVEVSNASGCVKESNEVEIRVHPLPAKKKLIASKYYYCEGETGTTNLVLQSPDMFIKYEFFKASSEESFEAKYREAASPLAIMLPVPLEEETYHVIATDTATGCSVAMSNTVRIQSSKLTVLDKTISVDVSHTEVRLDLTVTNAIGTPTIVWSPAELILSEDNKYQPWVNITDMPNYFTATVTDTASKCVKEGTIQIIYSGSPLDIIIHEEDCETDIDSLWVCEGAKYTLCSEIIGGDGGVYTREWRWKNESGTENIYLGNTMKITKPATTSGYIIATVQNGRRSEKDTVWLEVLPKPGTGIVMPEELCAAPNEEIEIALGGINEGVKYALEYSKTGATYTATGDEANGDNSGVLVFTRDFEENNLGYYRISAEKEYTVDGVSQMCTSVHERIVVRRGAEKINITGGGSYCPRPEKDTITLAMTEVGTVYSVLYKSDISTEYQPYSRAGTLTGDGETMHFVGNWQSGSYKVLAQAADEHCLDTMNGIARIEHLQKPTIGDLVSDKMEYCIEDGETIAVSISLTDAVAGNMYTLFRQAAGGTFSEGEPIIGESGTISFGTDFSEDGKYFVVEDNGSCTDTAGYVRIMRLPETLSELEVVGDTGYCVGMPGAVVNLKLYPIDPLAPYYVVSATTNNRVAEFTTYVDDTVFYNGTLTKGRYLIKSIIAECEAVVSNDTFTIVEYPLPSKLALLQPTISCEGTPISMGVQGSQTGVLYELYKEVDGGIAQMIASEEGDGDALKLADVGDQGTYYILAQNILTGCKVEIPEYTVRPQPQQFDLAATDTVYCMSSSLSGTDLYLIGTENGVTYTLQKWNDETSKYENIAKSTIAGTGTSHKSYFSGTYGAGTYRVVCDMCNNAPIGDPLEIIGLELPETDRSVLTEGNICADSTIKIIVSTEQDVLYSVWTGSTQVESAADVITGTGNDESWTFTTLKSGTYEIRAERKEGKTVCRSILDTKIEVNKLPEIGTLPNDKIVCENATTTLEMTNLVVIQTASYDLVQEDDRNSIVSSGEKSSGKVTFQNVPPGEFYVKATRGACTNYSGLIAVDAIPAPDIDLVDVAYEECNDESVGGTISLSNTVDTLYYWLKDVKKDEIRYTITTSSHEFIDLPLGTYYLRVQDMKSLCYSEYDTIALKAIAPIADTLIGNFAYCYNEGGATLAMRNTTPNVHYRILHFGTEELIEEMWGGTAKAYFAKKYVAGKYIFTAERKGNNIEGCLVKKTFEIKSYPIPNVNLGIEVAEPKPFCEGDGVTITVKGAEENVAYILRRNTTTAVQTINGPGDISFDEVSEAGDYTILPKYQNICGNTELDTMIRINKLPSAIEIVDGFYCKPAGSSEETGSELKLYDGKEHVRYILTNSTNDRLDTVYGNYALPYLTYKPQPVGQYHVRMEDTITGCVVENAASVSIESGFEPEVLTTGGCGESAEVATVEAGQEEVSYYLYKDNVRQTVDPIVGDGNNNISFGVFTVPGVYRIYGVNGDCGVFMEDSVVVHKPFVKDVLVKSGSYCEGGASTISLRVENTVDGWRYFLTKDAASSEIKAARTDGSPLIWNKVGGSDMRAGRYKLHSLDACGNSTVIDSLDIEVNEQPQKYPFVEGDYVLCQGDTGTLTLSGTEANVRYDLYYVYGDGEGERRLILTQEGTGDELLLSDTITTAGKYVVIGTIDGSECAETVATNTVTVIPGVENPGVIAADLCLDDPDEARDALTITLSYTDIDREHTDYYLLYRVGTNGVPEVVDSIKRDMEGHEAKQAFEEQINPGVYFVRAKGPTCSRDYKGARIGYNPDVQEIIPTGEQSICPGGKVELTLSGSEVGVEYELYTINVVGLDTNYISTYKVKEGTGEPMTLAEITAAGRYMVKAKNACIMDMDGVLEVKMHHAYDIMLRPEGYTICAQDDSTKIEILGITNTNPGAAYYIFPPGASMDPDDNEYSEIVDPGEWGSSVESTEWYKEPGFYRIMGVDDHNCPELDSVEIKVKELPNLYTLEIFGNNMLCDSESTRTLVLNGGQAGVNYFLYKIDGGNKTQIEMFYASSRKDEIRFIVSLPGTYVVEAEYAGNKACPVRMNGQVTIQAYELQQFELQALVGSYCDRPVVLQKGKVQLQNSIANIKYQLYKNGQPYGAAIVSSSDGEKIEWDNLDGGRVATESTPASPIKYNVMAIDEATGCYGYMLNEVEIIAESKIQFNDDHMMENVPKCIGEKLQIQISAYGGKISYQWKKDGVAIPGATQYVYVREALDAADMGQYYCVMENSCGTDSTRVQSVVPGLIVEGGGNDTIAVCNLAQGASQSVQLWSSALNAERWVWYKDGELLAEQPGQGFWVTVSQEEGAGEYTCKASNNCGIVWDTVLIKVDSMPVIEVNFVKDTLCNGATVTLSATSNYPINWWKGSEDLNITENTLTLEDIQLADAATYYAVSENLCGTAREPVMELVVDEEIELIDSQKDFYVCLEKDASASLWINTKPTHGVFYEWKDSEGTVVGTDRQLTLNASQLEAYTDAMEQFTVSYHNTCGSASTQVNLHISDSIKYKFSAKEIELCVNNTIADTTVSITVENPRNMTYLWVFEDNSGSGKKDTISYTDKATIPVMSKNAGIYYVILNNGCYHMKTDSAILLKLDTILELDTNLPAEKNLCAGSSFTLEMRAKGGSVLYKWFVQKTTDAAPVEIKRELLYGAGVTTSLCEVKGVDASYDGAKFWCEMSNGCGLKNSGVMDLTIKPAPKVTITPSEAEICEGENAQFKVSMTEGVMPWSFRYKRGGEFSEVFLVNTQMDTIIEVSEGGQYRINYLRDQTCTLEGGELASANLYVMEVSKASMTAVDLKNPVCPGSKVTFKINITGAPVGPWDMMICRKSDGKPATEIGFDNYIFLNKKDTTFSFYPTKTEEYYLDLKMNVMSGSECAAHNETQSIKVEVMTPPVLSVNTLEETTFGMCPEKKINLATLYNAKPIGYGDGSYIAYYTRDGISVSGDWMAENAKTYTIGYTLQLGGSGSGCTFKYTLGMIDFVAPPKVSIMNTRDQLCDRSYGSTVSITAVGAYPLSVSYRILELNEDNTTQELGTYSNVPFTDASSVKNLDVSFDPNVAGRIYEVTRVEDKYGCWMTELVADTIFMPGIPEYTLYTRGSVTDDWKPLLGEDVTYLIRQGDSVLLKAELTKGKKPWAFMVGNPIGGHGFEIRSITENTVETSLKYAGGYILYVADGNGCMADMEYLKGVYVDVVDTAYVKVKAILQGAYNETSQQMHGELLDLIGKRGLISEWPDVGGREIIDWVEIETWKGGATMDTAIFWDAVPALLLSDGTVVDKNGSEVIKILGRSTGFILAIRPRNHLPVWTHVNVAMGVAWPETPLMIDFTNPAKIRVPLGGDIKNHVHIMGTEGKYVALAGGDGNFDRIISSFDPNSITIDWLKSTLTDIATTADLNALFLDVNYDRKLQWPGFNTIDTKDWYLMYKNRVKHSMVPFRSIKWE